MRRRGSDEIKNEERTKKNTKYSTQRKEYEADSEIRCTDKKKNKEDAKGVEEKVELNT